MDTDIDLAALREAAREVMTRAYAPYSGFAVGAAALTENGGIVTGCNVENVSYGLGVCAEVAMVANAVGGGSRRLIAVSVAGPGGVVLAPCGRCRQVLLEFGGPGLVVDGGAGARLLGDLLPDAFGPAQLAAARTGGAVPGGAR